MAPQGVALLDTDRAEYGVIDGVLPGDLSVSLDENQPGGTGAQSGIVSLAVDGTVNIPDNLNSAMGQVFTDANIDDFVAAVNSGATGLIGLQISTDGQALELGAMSVVSGQDVRVFSTASDTTLASIAGADVEEGGMLTISGTVQFTDFLLISSAWSPANAGTVAFDGGVTAVLPDGTAPAISGSIPGTLTAEWGGSTVVSIARSDSSATASFTPSDWSAVQWFGDAEIDDFVAAVNSGATGLIGLQISTDGQALELGAMNVVSGQDVRVFSTASNSTLAGRFLSVATGGMLTISGTVQLTDFFLVSAAWLSVNAGTVAFDGGVTAVLPDGTAPSISGSIPGTLTAEWGGSTVVSIARSDSSATASFTPSDWSAVQWFGDANIDDFVAAVNSGATGLIGLQISTDGQALELGAMNVVSGQDVRVFSTASEVTVTHTGALSVATGAMLTISGTISSLEYTESFEVATGGSLTVLGTVVLDSYWLVWALRADGEVVLGGGLTMPLPDGTAVSLDGELPGQITAQRDGATVGTVSRDGTGTVAASPDGWYGVVITIKAWGGGGAGGSYSGGNPWGGAGGFAEADYLAVAGETLTVTVGGGGSRCSCSGGAGSGGYPNGGDGNRANNGAGGGGGSSHVVTSRDSTGVIVGAGGGGGGAEGNHCSSAGGGGGGTQDGVVGEGGQGAYCCNSGGCNGNPGTNGGGGGGGMDGTGNGGAGGGNGGRGGSGANSHSLAGDGSDSNGAGGSGDLASYDSSGGGGGGASSFKGVLPGTSRTVDATTMDAVNIDDTHYSLANNGKGGTSGGGDGTDGRVVLIVGGEATTFDNTGIEANFVVQ
jgi:hypothetical protein